MMDEKYMALPPIAGDAGEVRDAISGRNILVTVAFEDPAGLEMHISLIRRYVEFDEHVIVDNSRNLEIAVRNREIASRLGALYLQLPPNPWTKRNDSRSHGIALNWTWRNIIKPAAPRAFGLIDDDMFPVAQVAPFAPLAEHAFYGDRRVAGPRWFLWAGYCFFRFDAVSDKRLDFGLDWFVGLDTGGANWDVLYRHVDPKLLPERQIEQFAALPDLPRERAYFERRGGWIHEVGWPRDTELRLAKRVALTRLLAPHLEPEGSFDQVRGRANAGRESSIPEEAIRQKRSSPGRDRTPRGS